MTSPDPVSLSPEVRAANRSANFGCLFVSIALCMLIFAFALGGYSAYRLHEYRQELIQQHVAHAIIQEIDFDAVTAEEAMSRLKELAVRADPWFKGVQFTLYTEQDLKDPVHTGPSKLQKPISIHLKQVAVSDVLQVYIRATGGKIEIIDGSVNLLPANETLEPRKLLSLKQVEPDFWKSHPLVKAEVPAEFWDVRPLLAAEGLPFLPRTHARYYPDQKRLEINNLKANNEKISAWLREKKIIPAP